MSVSATASRKIQQAAFFLFSFGCLVHALPFLHTEAQSNETDDADSRHVRARRRRLAKGGGGAALFRFALVTDSHVWPRSHEQRAFSVRSDAQPIRDGLLVAHSPEIFERLLDELARFARGGGAFAVHAGDPACGGASFHASGAEFEAQLRAVASAERAALPAGWPVYHMPGNHDLHPETGGVSAWARILGNSSGGGGGGIGAFHEGVGGDGDDGDESSDGGGDGSGAYYRALRRDGWRVLLLDSASAVRVDTDGHGRIGLRQRQWLEAQLEAAGSAGEQVIVIVHQLLVPPTDENGVLHRWFVAQYDLVENAHEVLAILRKRSHVVRLVLHGHVHANSLTMWHGVPFMSSSAVAEYPMTWREVLVSPCELEVRTHALDVPELLDKSAKRDTRGVNEAKRGGQREQHLLLRGLCRRG